MEIGLVLCLLLVASSAAAAPPTSAPRQPPTPLVLPSANTLNRRSPLGTNLAAVTDWTAEYPFINHFKMARPWFPASASAWEDSSRPLSLDANGNVKALLPGQFARSVVFTGRPADPGLANKVFQVRWTGSGALEYGNVRVLRREAGVDTIQVMPVAASGAGNADAELIAIFTLVRTDPAKPLRNIRLLAPGGICAGRPFVAVGSAAGCPAGAFRPFHLHHAQLLFNPSFLEGLRRYRLLRFMDWQRTNGSPQQHASQRALPTHQFWSTERGVPWEVMVALANVLGADPWLCIPHRASDAYVLAFAKVLGARLAPGLRAHIEYSNEVWNGIFEQNQDMLEQGEARELGHMGPGQPPDRYTGAMRFYSQRAQQVFAAVLRGGMGGGGSGAAQRQRIRRVMASQAVVPYFTEVILRQGNASSVTDLFAIAPYFGNTWTQAAQAAALKALGVAGVFAWLNIGSVSSCGTGSDGGGGHNGVLGYGSLACVDAAVAAQQAVLRPLGIPLGFYEGGQHLLAAGALAGDAELNALLDAVNRDPRMKATYLAYLTAWRQRTGQLLTHFVHCDRWSQYGRWGVLEYPAQPRSKSPKLDALLTYIANRPLDM